MNTRILAIDPGYDRIGIAVIEKSSTAKERLIFSECFVTDRTQDIDTRIFDTAKEIIRIIELFDPSVFAIENVYFQSNQKTVIGVSEAKGVFKYIAHKHGLAIHEYSPPQIKTAVTGDGRATKDQVARMVPKLIRVDLDEKETRDGKSKGLDDEIDAIAVALTCSAHLMSGARIRE